MHIRHAATIDDHVGILRQEPAEVAALFRDLLIAVTKFFRDAGAFESPASVVIPALFKNRTGW